MFIRKSAKKQEAEAQAQKIADAEREIKEAVQRRKSKLALQNTKREIDDNIKKIQSDRSRCVEQVADIYDVNPALASKLIRYGEQLDKADTLLKSYKVILDYSYMANDVTGKIGSVFQDLVSSLQASSASSQPSNIAGVQDMFMEQDARMDRTLRQFEDALNAFQIDPVPADEFGTHDSLFERDVINQVRKNKADAIDD